jgi:hypothetical protein
MKKITVIFRKDDNRIYPEYPEQLAELNKQAKNGSWFKAEFSEIKRSKTNAQLGYIFAVAYPCLIAHYVDRQGYLYETNVGGIKIEVEANTDTIDMLMKTLFAIHKGIKKFKKEKASIEDLSEYID